MFKTFTQMNNQRIDPDEPETWGHDYYDDDIYLGDGYYDFDGDLVLEHNVDRYVEEIFMAQASWRIAGR